jgi:membrane protein
MLLRLNKRSTAIFIIGSILNIVLFVLARYASFPIWLDFSGSIFISFTLGPIAGAASVLLHAILTVFLYSGWSALWLLPTMLCLCLLTAYFSRHRFMENPFISLSAVFITIICSLVIAYLMIFPLSAKIPAHEFLTELKNMFGTGMANLYYVCATKFPDLILSWAIAGICILLTPKQKTLIGFKRK